MTAICFTWISSAPRDNPTTPLQRKYGDFYAACMDSDLADQLGEKPVEPVLAKIDALSNKKDLAALVSALSVNDGTRTFFAFGSEQDQKDATKQIAGIYQSGLSLPDRDYYLEDDAHMTKIRGQYKDYATALFKLAGDDDATAAREADAVITIETALAKGSLPQGGFARSAQGLPFPAGCRFEHAGPRLRLERVPGGHSGPVARKAEHWDAGVLQGDE